MAMTDFYGHLSSVPEAPEAVEQIRKTPEGRFLWAILENGIEQYQKNATATERRGRRLFRETEEWILCDDPTWLCSFMSICHVLWVDPDYLSTRLHRFRKAQLSRRSNRRRNDRT
jgi:hypothetical protein